MYPLDADDPHRYLWLCYIYKSRYLSIHHNDNIQQEFAKKEKYSSSSFCPWKRWLKEAKHRKRSSEKDRDGRSHTQRPPTKMKILDNDQIKLQQLDFKQIHLSFLSKDKRDPRQMCSANTSRKILCLTPAHPCVCIPMVLLRHFALEPWQMSSHCTMSTSSSLSLSL